MMDKTLLGSRNVLTFISKIVIHEELLDTIALSQKSFGLNGKAFNHVRICIIAFGIRGNETNCPEDKDKDQGADGQHQGADRV